MSGNLLVYYEQGNPKKFVVPDVFVVKDLEPRRRRTYKLWVEQRAPDAIVEVTSRKTKKKDTITKPKLYRRLGVKEYFLFDPTEDYLDPPLQGYRLEGRRLRADRGRRGGELGEQGVGPAAARRRGTPDVLPAWTRGNGCSPKRKLARQPNRHGQLRSRRGRLDASGSSAGRSRSSAGRGDSPSS